MQSACTGPGPTKGQTHQRFLLLFVAEAVGAIPTPWHSPLHNAEAYGKHLSFPEGFCWLRELVLPVKCKGVPQEQPVTSNGREVMHRYPGLLTLRVPKEIP